MKKLLVVCGPTATGKSSLGFSLARKFNGEIVSADSRQVYSGMDIGTGKEWKRGVKIWGYDLVEPKKEFNVSKYLKFSKKILADIWKRDKLPILVGGTGLYIRGVVDGIPTSTIPRNEKLREKLEGKRADELFESLSQLDSIRAGSMNSSDRKNPRRLVRAIEIAQWKLEHGNQDKLQTIMVSPSILMIGLSADSKILDERINLRVEERIKSGVKGEVEDLIKSGISWDSQAMLALGYRQWRDYFEGGVEEDVVVDEWKREERKYSRRQMTWFKKDNRVVWFDISAPDYQKEVENLVKKWYSTPDAKKS